MSGAAARALAGLLLLLAAVRTQAPAGDGEPLWIRVTAGATEREFGAAFDLTVERRWDDGWRPDPWTDEVLAPLAVELVDVAARAVDGGTAETRRYRARVFEVGEITVPAPWFRARSADGAMRVAFADDLELRVSSVLGPEPPGPPDLPGDVLPAPFSWRRVALPVGLAVVGLATAGLFVRRRLRRAADAAAARVEPAGVVARRRIAALRDEQVAGRDAERAWVAEAASIARDYAGARFGLVLRDRTSEELLAVRALVDACPADLCADLAWALGRCDGVKFAAGATTSDERTRIADVLELLVARTEEPA